MVVVILKVVIGSLLRGYMLYKVRGIGWWMLAALWHTAFVALTAPMEIVREAANRLKEAIEEIPGYAPGYPNAPPGPNPGYQDLQERVRLMQAAQMGQPNVLENDRLDVNRPV